MPAASVYFKCQRTSQHFVLKNSIINMSSAAIPGLHVTESTYSLGPALKGVGLTVVVLAATACSGRVYVRVRQTVTAGLDDVAIVIATLLAIFGVVCGWIFVPYGIGTHIWLLSPGDVSNAIKWLVISVFQSYIALFFIRLSIALFLLRMLSRTQMRLKLAVYTCLFLNTALTIMICTVLGLWCRPLDGVWDKSIKAQCLSDELLTNANRAFASLSAATDVLYSALPVAIVWPLQMSWKTKRDIAIVMLFTLVICVCAIGKAVNVNETDPDVTYQNGQQTFWALMEVTLGIIVACLPALRQLYKLTRDDYASWQSRRSARSRREDGSGPGQIEARNPSDASDGKLKPASETEDHFVEVWHRVDVENAHIANIPPATRRSANGIWDGNGGLSEYHATAESAFK